MYSSQLGPNTDPEECVFLTLTFGLKCASGQSECTKTKLSDEIRETKPEVATLLEISTFVDDLGDSKDDLEKVHRLQRETDEEFEQIGLKVKEWTKTGEAPTEIVCEDGYRVPRIFLNNIFITVEKEHFEHIIL